MGSEEGAQRRDGPASRSVTPAGARLLRVLAAVSALLFGPPALASLAGGADLEPWPGWRLEWYDAAASLVALVAALGLAAMRPRISRVGWGLSALTLALLLVAAAVLWTGGIQAEWLSLTKPARPVALAFVSLLGALAARSTSPRIEARVAALWLVALACGAFVLSAAVEALNRRTIRIYLGEPRAEAVPRPDVILVLADTLRADALGAYGADPSRTPFLDGLAARSRVFEAAWAQAPWTVPSVASLFSSLYPSTLDPVEQDILRSCGFAHWRLPSRVPTLASHLQDAGYLTLGLQKNPLLRPGTGFERGFVDYRGVGGDRAEDEAARHLSRAARRTGRALADARAAGDARPFFLYAHFMDPHLDYSPPSRWRPDPPEGVSLDGSARQVHARVHSEEGPTAAEVEYMRALYAAEVAYLDAELAGLHDALARLGLWTDDTLVVFLSDHGEQFGEHGRYEHCDVNVENVRVPLFFAGPGIAPGRSRVPARLVDVAPTLLELTGTPPLEGAEGRSLVGWLGGGSAEASAAAAPEPMGAAITEHKRGFRVTSETHALLIGKQGEALYDRVADPEERRPLPPEGPAADSLRAALAEHRSRERPDVGEREAGAELDAETRDSLRALGYLD